VTFHDDDLILPDGDTLYLVIDQQENVEKDHSDGQENKRTKNMLVRVAELEEES
jgi:hypothetical protein